MKKFTLILAMAVISMASFSQTVLFTEDFNDGSGAARWDTVQDGENAADFLFDYTTAGLPASPNGGGYGLKLESNLTQGVSSRIYAFPIGQTFSGTYTVQFDYWIATDTSGSGTTEFALSAVMLQDETVPVETGVMYAFTGENGSGSDVRVHEYGSLIAVDEVPGAYLIDPETGTQTRNNNYDDPAQPGVYSYAYEGMMPMNQWLTITIEVSPDSLIWSVNGFRWSAMTNALNEAGNIAIGHADWFSSVASPAGAMFGLYDNITVTDPTVGINDLSSRSLDVSVYPNPAKGSVNVDVQERSEMILINAVGQIVQRSMVEKGQNTISLSGIKQGIYYARFTSESGQEATHKIVVK